MKFRSWLMLFLILLILPAAFPLFQAGFPSTHDGITHVVRFLKFHQALSEGQIIPLWADGIAFGLGSPVLMYNAFLPYLAAELPKIIGFDWPTSIEIIFVAGLLFSGLAFYFWIKEIFGPVPAFIGALFYVWAPYRFVDVYVRGAYPENFAFIFPPLIFLSVKKMIEADSNQWLLLGIISTSALILSHNVMAILFLTIIVAYSLLINAIKGEFRKVNDIFLMVIFSLLITAFFWLPAFFERGYVNLDKLNLSKSYLVNFVTPSQLIYSQWGWGPLGSDSPMSLQIGISQQLTVLLATVVTLLVFFGKKIIPKLFKDAILLKINQIFLVHYLFFLFLFLFAIFLMTGFSRFLWENIGLLSFFLYPWRFLALTTFASALIAAYLIYLLKNNKAFVIVLILLLLYTNRNHLQLVGQVKEKEVFYQNYVDTTDMWGEFLPVWADLDLIKDYKFKNYTPFKKIIVPEEVVISNIRKDNSQVSFNYESPKGFSATINTFYFPGWNIYLDKTSNQKITINKLGTMNLFLPFGKHEVRAKYQPTQLRQLSSYLSIFGLVIILGYLWQRQKRF